MFRREPFEPEPDLKLRVWYKHADGRSAIYTAHYDGTRNADKMARIFADLETTERVVIYMTDGTTRVYLGPKQRRDSGLCLLPMATIGG